MTNILKINPADNVVVAIQPQTAGAVIEVDGKQITVLEDVPAGHKIAITDLAEGENVIKYGFPIGHAKEAKKAGSWMNENNIKTNLAGLLEYEYHPKEVVLNIPDEGRTFMGYRRKDGQVGIRNEVWIIPTVGCVNGIIERCADRLRQPVHPHRQPRDHNTVFQSQRVRLFMAVTLQGAVRSILHMGYLPGADHLRNPGVLQRHKPH